MLLELARLATIPVFVWAAWWDWRERRVPVEIWGPLSFVGIVLLAVDVATNPAVLPTALTTVVLLVSIAYVLFRTGAGVGGADIKALVAMAFVFPHTALVALAVAAVAAIPFWLFDRVRSQRGNPFLVPLVVGIIVSSVYVIV